MTVGYMTKLIVCIFFEENSDKELQAEYDRTQPAATPFLLNLLTVCAALCPLLGLTPHYTLENIARFAQGFFAGEGPEETIRYFSLGNLKGGAISIVIGAVLYFGFVRTLVRRREDGKVVYRNPWPRVLSLEDSFYRPLLMVWLPFIGAVCARLAASIFEWLTLLANKVLFFRFDPIVTPPEDEKFANYDPHPQGRRGNFGTLNFGLTLFGLGYMTVMIYLLVRQFIL
jgi:hydrogenase-4 component B